MTSSRAAVLLSTYNGERYLSEFLESLARQTFRDFDLIVRDDGSTDDTASILHSYEHRISIRRVASSQRLGAARSFMQLLTEAGDTYDAYLFADQDDYWNPDKLALATKAMAACSGTIALYFSRLEVVSESLEHVKYSRVPRIACFDNVLVENVASGCTIAMNSRARAVVLKSPPTEVIMHDWWCHLVISAIGKIVYDETPTLKYRQHGANVVGASRGFMNEVVRRIQRFAERQSTGVFGVSAQAAELLRCFRDDLSPIQVQLVEDLLRGKQALRHRLPLFWSRRYQRQRWTDTLILRVLFLLGRY